MPLESHEALSLSKTANTSNLGEMGEEREKERKMLAEVTKVCANKLLGIFYYSLLMG